MKAVEFYSRAQGDPVFRAQQLDEAAYHKRIAVGFALVLGTAWLGYVAYCGIAQKRWPGDLGVGLSLVLCASLYGQARARQGALQAMQSGEPGQPPAPVVGRRD